MSDHLHSDDRKARTDRAPHGLTGADVLGVIAISTFLAAIGLATFWASSAFGG